MSYNPFRRSALEWTIIALVGGGFGFLVVLALVRQPEGQAYSKRNKARADLLVLASSLDAYRSDHGAYPPATNSAYGTIGAVPLPDLFDPFQAKDTPLAYYAMPDRWVAFSIGPDKKRDIDDPAKLFDAEGGALAERKVSQTYDPSNGTFSPGDIWQAVGPIRPEPPANVRKRTSK